MSYNEKTQKICKAHQEIIKDAKEFFNILSNTDNEIGKNLDPGLNIKESSKNSLKNIENAYKLHDSNGEINNNDHCNLSLESFPKELSINEVLVMISHLLNQLLYLKKCQYCYPSLIPLNILLDKEKKAFLDLRFIKKIEQKTIISSNISKYSSPGAQINDFLNNFEEEKKEKTLRKSKFDIYKSNVFSLGLIILELLGVSIFELTSSIKIFVNNIIQNIDDINDFSISSFLKYKSLMKPEFYRNNDIKNSFRCLKHNIISVISQVKSLDLRMLLYKTLKIYSLSRIGLKNMLENITTLLQSLNSMSLCKQNKLFNQLKSDNAKIWHSRSINYLKVLKQSNSLITSGGDGAIRLWNIKKKICELIFFIKRLEVTCITISPDEIKILAGYSDNKLRIWSLNLRCLIAEISGHISPICNIEISNNSKYAITAASENILWIIDLEKNEKIDSRIYENNERNNIICFAIDPTEEIVAVGEKKGLLCIWWIHEKTQMSRIDAYDTEIDCVSFMKNPQFLVTGSICSLIKIWNLDSMSIYYYYGHQSTIQSLIASLIIAENYILSCSRNGLVKIFNFDTLSIVYANTESKNNDLINCACLNKSKDILFIGTNKGLKMIDIFDKNEIFPIKINKKYKKQKNIEYLDANSKNVFFTGTDSVIRIWNFSNMNAKGKFKAEIERDLYGISCAIKTKDGKYLISGGYNGMIKVRNLLNCRELVELQYDSYEITAIDATSDNELIISGDVNGIIILWSLLSMSLLCYAKVNSFLIKDIKIFNDNLYAGIGGEDGLVNIWNIKTREITAKYIHGHSIHSIAIYRNCKYILVACELIIKVWKIDYDSY